MNALRTSSDAPYCLIIAYFADFAGESQTCDREMREKKRVNKRMNEWCSIDLGNTCFDQCNVHESPIKNLQTRANGNNNYAKITSQPKRLRKVECEILRMQIERICAQSVVRDEGGLVDLTDNWLPSLRTSYEVIRTMFTFSTMVGRDRTVCGNVSDGTCPYRLAHHLAKTWLRNNIRQLEYRN